MKSKRVLVDVTAECIAKGRKRNSKRCPVALAAELAGLLYPSVGTEILRWAGNKVTLPAKAKRFIARFDYSCPVRPFSFYVKEKP